MTRFAALFALVAAIGSLHPASARQVMYVDADASGAGNGSSWTDAYTSLQDAIDAASAGDLIWVASGTYTPDDGTGLTPGDRSLAFHLKSGVRLHGGFAGTESSIGDRLPKDNPTFLSGDLARDDDGFSRYEDNSFHVVRAVGADDGTLLEGFTIVGGRAEGTDADSLGGGILIEGGAPWIINSRFNSSTAGCGGGVALVAGAAPTFVNTVMNGNRATVGGGVCALDAEAELTNATVTNNTALRAPGIYNSASDVTVFNSIVAGNMPFTVADHCEVWQYPCSYLHESEQVKQLTDQVMEAALDAASGGNLEGALAYLQNHPDVVQAFGDSTTVAARVAGGSIAFLYEASALQAIADVSPPDAPFQLDAGGVANVIGAVPAAKGAPAFVPGNRTIVGEDRTGDGIIDNHDFKRALVMSPFSFEQGLAVTNLLWETPGYETTTTFVRPPELSGDYSLQSWLNWDEFDFVYVGTHTLNTCGASSSPLCPVIMNSGIRADQFDAARYKNEYLHRAWPLEDGSERPFIVLGVKFFRDIYGGRLQNSIVLCAYCGVDNAWQTAMGSLNFSLVGMILSPNYLEVAQTPYQPADAVTAIFQLLEWQAFGLTLENVRHRSNFIRDLITARPSSPSMRITEIPRLLYNPGGTGVDTPLADLTDITDIIRDRVEDGKDDKLHIQLLVMGVTPETRPIFDAHRILVNGEEYPKEIQIIDGNAGIFVEGTDGSWVVYNLTIDLGFDVIPGFYLLEAVVDVPGSDGGESIYRALTTVDAFKCSARTEFSGYRSGAFTGAALWGGDHEAATLRLVSTAAVLGVAIPELRFSPNDYVVDLYVNNPEAEGGAVKYNVFGASLGHPNLPGTWFLTHDENDDDCAECGGIVTVDRIGMDGITRYGTYEFTGRDVTGNDNDLRLTTVEGTFRAVPGPSHDTQSPYFDCLEEYREAIDP